MADDFDSRVFALETAFKVLARELHERNLVSLGQLGDALAVEAQLVRRAGADRRGPESTPASPGIVALARSLREAAARTSGAGFRSGRDGTTLSGQWGATQ
jgi:hypothetical protein